MRHGGHMAFPEPRAMLGCSSRMRHTIVVAAAIAAALPARDARAAQLHVPLHVPPRLDVRGGEGASLIFGLGWHRASAPGLAVDGPGGGWELAVKASRRLDIDLHLHSDGFVFGGSAEPTAGRRETGGLSGTFELDASKGVGGGGARVYAGALVSLTTLDVADPLTVSKTGTGLRVEPDLATSIVLGFPVGLLWRSREEPWSPYAAAYGLFTTGGATFFSYSVGPPGFFGSSVKIDPNLGGGARAGFEYRPWRLSLEAGGGLTASAGGNESLATLYASLGWRLF